MSSIAFISSASHLATGAPVGGGTVSITVPAGVTANHMCVLLIADGGSYTDTGTIAPADAGWATRAAAPSQANNSKVYIYTKLGGYTAGQTINLTASDGTIWSVYGAWYDTQGYDLGVIGSVGGRSGTSSANTVIPGITTLDANTDVLLVATERTLTTGTTVTGYTSSTTVTQDAFIEDTNSPTSSSALFGHFTPTAGPTGDVTVTYSGGSGNGAGMLLGVLTPKTAPIGIVGAPAVTDYSQTTQITSLDVTVPTGAKTGEILLATCLFGGGAGIPNNPANWTKILSYSDSAKNSVWVGYRVVDGTEASSYTWSWGGPTRYATCTISRVAGTNTASPVRVSADNTAPTTQSQTYVGAALTGVQTTDEEFYFFTSGDANSATQTAGPTVSTGWTADFSRFNSQQSVMLAHSNAVGSIAAPTATGDAATLIWSSTAFALEKAVAPSAVYTFDHGTEGAAVPVSGNITSVDAGIVYAAAAAKHGAFGITATNGTSAGPVIIVKRPTTDTSTAATVSMYMSPVSIPAGGIQLASFQVATNAVLAIFRAHSNGHFQIAQGGGTKVAETLLSWQVGTWYRVDMTTDATTGAATMAIFAGANVEGTVADETISATASTGAAIDHFLFSPARSSSGVDQAYVDTIRIYDGAVTPAPYSTGTVQPPPPTPTVVHSWQGAPSSDGFTVVSHLQNATSVRMAVSATSDMASPVYSAPVTPDADGYVRTSISGLSAGMNYYYQLADTPSGGSEALIGAVGRARTLPSTNSFTFALSSCITTNATDPAAMDDVRNWNPDFFVFTGDFHYEGLTDTTIAGQRAGWESQIAGSTVGLSELIRDVPMMYCTSDHEAGPDNGDSNNAYTTANIEAYEQIVPYYTLADTRTPTVGRYQSWVVGRVRFIMLDIRNTDRSPGANVDDATKTMLGATQKQWLKDQLVLPEPVKVIVSDVAWLGAASITNGTDKWWSYATERQEIADYITANGVKVVLMHGDTHALGVCTPANNPWGSFPVYCGSPMHNTGGGRNLASFSTYWNNAGGACRAYGRITVTDTGDQITFNYSGWDATAGVERVAQTDSFAAIPGGSFQIYDGTTETVPSGITIWDGTTEAAPSSTEIMSSGISVTQMSSTSYQPFFIAHRGGSADWAEHSLRADTQSAYLKMDGIEISVARTSDGVYFGLHDQTLNRTTPTAPASYDPSQHTWAEVSAYQCIAPSGGDPAFGAQPYCKLTDALAAYAKSHVIFIDPKYIPSTYYSNLLDIMDANGGTDRFIAKFSGGGETWTTTAKARGYKSWGYFYQTDITSGNLNSTTAAKYDWLGMECNATTANWTTTLSYGKPVIAHIAATSTDAQNGIAQGAVGVMVSGVRSVMGFYRP